MGRLLPHNTGNVPLSADTSNVYNFVYEEGNSSQIITDSRPNRVKFYTDALTIQDILNNPCVIGVNDSISGDCSEGIAMGTGEIGSSTETSYARY